MLCLCILSAIITVIVVELNVILIGHAVDTRAVQVWCKVGMGRLLGIITEQGFPKHSRH